MSKVSVIAKNAYHSAVLTEAHNAATAAIASLSFDEMQGACGFAWVRISGTEPLARYCRSMVATSDRRQKPIYGDKGYPNGWEFWAPGGYRGQRIDVKEAGAKAFRDALAKHGISATVGSRLD